MGAPAARPAQVVPHAAPTTGHPGRESARWWGEIALVAAGAAVWYGVFYFGRGLDVPDEGLLLHAAERLAQGQVPYRDIYFIYTPGLQYTLALLFRLVGPGLAVEHALLAALAVAMGTTVYALARTVAGWRPAAAAVALVAVFAGLNSYRFWLGLLVVAALGAYAQRPTPRRLLAVGALVGVTYLFAQEVGLYALGTALGYLGLAWLCGRPRRPGALLARAGYLLAGAGVVLGPWVLVLTLQGALGPMLDATLRVAFLHQPRYMHVPLPPLLPLVPDQLDTNVVYGPPPYLLYVKCLLYLPLVAALGGSAWFLWRLGREGLSPPLQRAAPALGFAVLALATIADRADYYHLRQLLPATLVVVAWLLAEGARGLERRAGHPRVRLLALLPLAPMLALSVGEARQWRADQSALLETPRGRVWVTAEQARDLGALLAALRARTAPGEPIFVWPAETGLYFLADRPNPTRFGQLVPTEAELLRERDGAVQRELLAAIDAAGVRWGVAAPTENVDGVPFAAYAPLLAAALDARFQPVARFGYWTLHARR